MDIHLLLLLVALSTLSALGAALALRAADGERTPVLVYLRQTRRLFRRLLAAR